MASKYLKGYYRERLVKAHLEKMGYLVFRSAASKGPWDLIGVKDDIILFIQVKSQNPGKKAREIFRTIKAKNLKVYKQIWVYEGNNIFSIEEE